MKKTISLLLCGILIFGMSFSTMLTATAANTAEAFSYVLNQNKKEYSVRIDTATAEIKIPSTYKGLPVTTVLSGSKGASTVKSIYIPDSITSIEDYAFENFKALESVSGNKGLRKIGREVFNGCGKLTDIELGKKIISIGRDAFKGTDIKDETDTPNSYIIGNYLIHGWANLNQTTITVPEGIITIADYAFENAFQQSDMVLGPKTVYLPESLRCIGEFAFFETWGMTDVKLPSKLLTIGEYAFSFNSGLKNVNIPASVKSIGIGAFSNCSNVNVTVDSANEYFKIADKVLFRKDGKIIYDHYGKMGCSYNVPEGVVKIADKAFYESDLTGVTISSTVKTIGESAFENSKKLKTAVIGKSVSTVGERAFADCTKLTTLTIQKGCATIGNHMFAGCTSLKSVSIPAGVKSIGHFAFCDCTNLAKLSLPSTITHIGSHAFAYTAYLNNAKYTNGLLYCGTNLVSTKASELGSTVTIKDGTTCIAGYTFNGLTITGTTTITTSKNTKVKKIVFPESLKYIGMYSFGALEGLTSITIPAGVKSVGEGTFNDCNNLKTVTIKGGTTEIGERSFGYVTGIKTIDVTICALKGSKAHSFATQNDYKFKSIGVYLTAPVLAAAKSVNGGLNIKWNAVKYAEGYRVYRKAPGETSWTRLADVKGLSYTDKNVANGKTYTYTVKAFSGKTFSGYDKTGISQKFIATPKLTKILNGSKGIQINWNKVSGADGYIVYKKTANGWTRVATVTSLSYIDKNVKAGSTYTYTVKAYDGSLFSGYNTTGISIKRLLTPELISATSGKTGITLKWNKVTGATGYYVYRKTGSGSWQRLATVTGNTKVSYLDKAAKKGTTYTYTVKAVSGKSTSSYNAKGLTVKDKY